MIFIVFYVFKNIHVFLSDGIDTQADSDVFPDGINFDAEDERSGDFYPTPASPTTVPYCPRPPSAGKNIHIVSSL